MRWFLSENPDLFLVYQKDTPTSFSRSLQTPVASFSSNWRILAKARSSGFTGGRLGPMKAAAAAAAAAFFDFLDWPEDLAGLSTGLGSGAAA